MAINLVGKHIEGAINYNIEDNRLSNIKNDTIVIIINKDATELYLYYHTIKTLLLNNNRVILIINNKSNMIKHICMLMVLYKRYDIYVIEDESILDIEHIDVLIGREPTEDEVGQYVDIDAIANEKLCDILLEMTTAIDDGDTDTLIKLAIEYKDVLQRSINVIGYLNYLVDNGNKDIAIKLKEYKSTINDLEEQLKKSDIKLREVANKLEYLEQANKTLQKEAFTAKAKLRELEEQSNSGEPIIKTYSTVLTSMVKCRAKSIIYFKEVSYVRYVNSFITKLAEILAKVNKLKVKLLIYDNKNAFNTVYKPTNVITSTEYVNNASTFVNSIDRLIIVECNQAIIEDILKADYDVIIIYDRLKQAQDIVAGNNVYKYWVINSSHEYDILDKIYKIDKHHVITRPGVFAESIPIHEVKDYRAQTETGRMAVYMKMTMADGKRPIIDVICDRTNINPIPRR